MGSWSTIEVVVISKDRVAEVNSTPCHMFDSPLWTSSRLQIRMVEFQEECLL